MASLCQNVKGVILMATVIRSNGVLEEIDTFAALANYIEAHAADTVESEEDDEDETVTFDNLMLSVPET